MRDDFCAFILTHGRPDNVITHNTLRKAGYTGKIYIVVDDSDKTIDRYKELYGDKVLVFSKADISTRMDEGDNFNDRRSIIYARNASFELAEQVGCKYFIQLDDDYTHFQYTDDKHGGMLFRNTIRKTLDGILNLMLDYFINTPQITTIAMAQGGDYFGGSRGHRRLRRKAMNSFICSTDRQFKFFGRINEDVNTYTCLGRMGKLFFTVMQVMLNQKTTQENKGGMTELYLDSGTYIKTFYSIMYSPSCVKISYLHDPQSNNVRIHHKISWNNTAVKILREGVKKCQ